MDNSFKSNISEIKEDLNNDTKKCEISKRKVDSLLKLGEGITHEFMTDESCAYSKDVPKGAELVSIKKLGGKSIVWNQLINLLDYNTTSENPMYFHGCKWIAYKDRLTVEGTLNEDSEMYSSWYSIRTGKNNNKIVPNHIYYSKDLLFQACTFNHKAGSNIYKFLTVEDGAKCYSAVVGKIGEEIPLTTFRPQLFDLTKMFGSGNEPTQEEFEAMFPDEYYEYSEPTIIHNTIFSVQERGKNLLNPNDYLQYTFINNKNNKLIYSDEIIYNYVKIYKLDVKPSETYTFQSSILNNPLCAFGKDDKNENLYVPSNIIQSTVKPFTITVPDGYYVMYLCLSSSRKSNLNYVVKNNDSSLDIIPPYHNNKYEIIEKLRNLDGYGWGITDSIHNYIDFENKKYVQMVDSIDLGTTKGWSYNTWVEEGKTKPNHLGGCVKNIFPKYKPSTCTLCEKYTWVHGIDSDMCFNDNSIACSIFDNSFKDLNSAMESLKGVIMFYQLKEEIITDISDIIPDGFLESLSVEEYGSLIFKSNLSDSFKLPVPSTEEYLVDLEKSNS